ncbi:uncharacterized protein [Dysidea avara]
MRYEAKHKYFKKTAQNLGNFTNIGKTVATRHQRYMCYKMTCSTNFLGADIAYGTATSTTVNDVEYRSDLLQYSAELHLTSLLQRVSYAEYNGTSYSKGTVVICTLCEDEPIFGKILDIIITESNTCLFIIEPLITNCFNKHYNSYEVNALKHTHIICKHQDLADYHPLTMSKSFNQHLVDKSFITVKYDVIE